jgi:two-component system chemotaxis response regulator CheB
MKATTVLIVDDSALIRGMFADMLSAEPDIRVIGTASDPYEAREKIKLLNPDVLTLDIEMPRMDGISFLEKIMALRPMPVIMISSLTQKGAEATIRALELGAFETIAKPVERQTPETLSVLREELASKIRAAAQANIRKLGAPRNLTPGVLSFRPNSNLLPIIAIGSSTGGVETLRDIFQRLPANTPPIVIAQHMPERFTQSFAARLESVSRMRVSEAANHDRLTTGHAYIAPGGKHLKITRIGNELVCRVEDGPLVSGHKPSVDVLFRSVAESAGDRAVGVILTGMGKDGAEGLKSMRDQGAFTIGQNAATCVVYGMPQAAMKLGAVQHETGLSDIPATMLRHCET